MNLETALAEFRSKSYFIWDDFLTPAEVALVAIDYKKIYRAGSFQLAGIGNGVGSHLFPVHFLEPFGKTQKILK
jgi:hypothetical protein